MLHEAGHPGLVLWGHVEGWGGEGRGREIQFGGDMCIPVASRFTWMCGRSIHNIVK